MSRLKFKPHYYQQLAINAIESFFATPHQPKLMLAGPTGVGKSVIELAVLEADDEVALITPSYGIIEGMLEKLQYDVMSMAEHEVLACAEEHRIYTPIKLRNKLLAGRATWYPTKLIYDESHHQSAESWQQIDTMLGSPPSVGLTATPYRGSAKSTAELRTQWGEPSWIITYAEALDLGVLSMPDIRTVPLVDDDQIEVRGGEFVIETIEAETHCRLLDAVSLIREFYVDGRWTRRTMISVPGSRLMSELHTACLALGLPVECVSAATRKDERKLIFERVVARESALIQINVVSEGVDLPLELLIDLTPIMSPVKWVQMIGRIMRPNLRPLYLCTNRNLLRHGYLLEGVLPTAKLIESQTLFGGPSRRAGTRVVGLEAIGRFKPIDLPLASGLQGLIYAVSTTEGHRVIDYAAIMHPAREELIWARRETAKREDGTKDYGTWARCPEPESLQGFGSLPPAQVTEKQANWWKRSAKRWGLDATAEVNRKNFQALPILESLRLRL